VSGALALFLSNGGSLSRWRAEGLLSRELLLYAEFLRRGVFETVDIFSYDAADQALLAELGRSDPIYQRMTVLTPPAGQGALSGLKASLYGFAGVLLHGARLRQARWFKTNQVSGSWAGVFASLVCRRPLMLRLGYVLSRRFELNGQSRRAALARTLEAIAFQVAEQIVVTSADARASLAARPAIAGKVSLLPTYVDVEAFREKSDYAFDGPMIYVGRLEPQKNVLNLVRACLALGRGLDLVGVGSLEPQIRALIAGAGARAGEGEGASSAQIRLLGRMPNEVLAQALQSYSIFLLPSLHEGLPKVLIEAMACGLVCIGSDIPGITDLVEDGVSGYLIPGFEADDIAGQIARADRERDAGLGHAARRRVEDVFSLQRYAAAEAALYAREPRS
jgi:glycosyltransferase involved in cell wall biosynthesis